jgi:hypothetical protein
MRSWAGAIQAPRLKGGNNAALNLAGSRYFVQHAPITDYDDPDRRMRPGEISPAIEIPAILIALSVGRGQELGSIVNFFI